VIFYNIYNQVGLPLELYSKAFPALLKGIAENYYYNNRLMKCTLEEAIMRIKSFFGGA